MKLIWKTYNVFIGKGQEMTTIELSKNCTKKIFYGYQKGNTIKEINGNEIRNFLEYHKLDMVYYSLCPDTCLQFLKLKRDIIAKKNIKYLLELEQIIKLFEKHNVDYVILKGWAVLASLYSHIEDRYFNDIDILVDERDLQKVENILLFCGYQYGIAENNCIVLADRSKILFQRRFTHELYNMVKEVSNNCFLNFDINYRFSWRGMNDRYIGQIGGEIIGNNKTRVTYKGIEFNILNKEMQFIHLCCHFFNEAKFFLLDNEFKGGDPCELRLFRLLDIFLLLPSIDIDKAKKIIKEFRCQDEIDFVMRILHVVLEDERIGLEFVQNKNIEIDTYFSREKEWRLWPLSVQERVFMLSEKEKICKNLF